MLNFFNEGADGIYSCFYIMISDILYLLIEASFFDIPFYFIS
jgi:hypothetical protein